MLQEARSCTFSMVISPEIAASLLLKYLTAGRYGETYRVGTDGSSREVQGCGDSARRLSAAAMIALENLVCRSTLLRVASNRQHR